MTHWVESDELDGGVTLWGRGVGVPSVGWEVLVVGSKHSGWALPPEGAQPRLVAPSRLAQRHYAARDGFLDEVQR